MTINNILTTPDKRFPVYLVEFQQGPNFYRRTTATDADQVFGSRIFTRNDPVSIDKISQSVSEGPGGEGTITLASTDAVVKLFDAFLPVEPLTCLVQYFELNDPDRQLRSILSGEVTAIVDGDDGTSKVTIKPLYQSFNRNVPWQVQQETCVLVTYGFQCGLNPRDFMITADGVIALTADYIQATPWATSDATYFRAGYVKNRRTRETRFVLDQQANGKLMLSYPFDQGTIADTYDAFAGDQRTGDVCQNKFHNKINFMGFEKIPTKNMFKAGIR